MHYAENECAMPIGLHCNEIRALCLTTNALCHTAEIGAMIAMTAMIGAITGMCADCLYLTGKGCRRYGNIRHSVVNSHAVSIRFGYCGGFYDATKFPSV